MTISAAPTTSAASVPAPMAMEISGSVGASTGNINQEGNLNIRGTIRNGMTVVATGDVQVGEGIEAAEVRAGGSMGVNGNIIGHGKGKCVSGGGVTFRIANAANIEALGDVVGSVEIVNCRIIASGAVRCEGGHIHGGHATANGGVVCDILGSAAGILTLVEPGIDERLRRIGATRTLEIMQNFKKIYSVRGKIVPLLRNQRSLTAKQKEIATEMLYEASQLEEQTENLVRDLRRGVAEIRQNTKPQVLVSKTLHAGVTIRFNDVETQIGEDVEGPLLVSVKPYGHSHQIVLTRLKSKSTVVLKTSARVDPHLAALEEAIADRKKQE